MLYKNKGKMI